jgi:FkbH-like protein
VASADHHVYVLEVADRFGEHGLVGTAVVRQEGDTWVIDNVLLSCRVMGLSVETALLTHIHAATAGHDVRRLVGEFIPTRKNGPCADFFQRHGFRPEPETGGAQRWVLDPRVERIETPSWITVKATGTSA